MDLLRTEVHGYGLLVASVGFEVVGEPTLHPFSVPASPAAIASGDDSVLLTLAPMLLAGMEAQGFAWVMV